MSRALAVFAACLLCSGTALADTVDGNVSQLHASGSSYKVRLSAALALSKSKDPRAIIALADALQNDKEPTVRRVSALALEKMIDAQTPSDAKALGLDALNQASTLDKDPKVRATADESLRTLAKFRKKATPSGGGKTTRGPSVFVNVDPTIDQSKKLSKESSARINSIVKSNVEKTGYATSWPGGTGLPTSADLSSSKSRGFIVASTVKKIDITKSGAGTQVSCTVVLRVAPWQGKDGGEKWEANKAASASGSAKAMTGSRDKDIEGGVRDCIEAVADDVTARQVVPFLKKVALAP